MSDAILLERFVHGREEAAFGALVQRHGPLVEQICRRILRNDHDVDDVFQATFLLLARKAKVIPWRDSVSGWLCAVARRLALHARSGTARQWGRETPISGLGRCALEIGGRGLAERYHPRIDPLMEVERRDLRRVLDAELLRLPEKYRAPVILCDLEGRTHNEAARQLGWPAGSMSRRLDRARRLLRRRLLHRGLALAVIGLIAAAIAALGGRAMPRVPPAQVVQETMTPFRPRGEGGQGLGQVLTALARADEPLPELSQVLMLARAAARSAARLADQDPGRLRDRWRQSATAMENSARELIRASQSADRLAMIAAARQLDASCLKCHDLLRDRVGRRVGRTTPAQRAAFTTSLLNEPLGTPRSKWVGRATGSERFRGGSRNGARGGQGPGPGTWLAVGASGPREGFRLEYRKHAAMDRALADSGPEFLPRRSGFLA